MLRTLVCRLDAQLLEADNMDEVFGTVSCAHGRSCSFSAVQSCGRCDVNIRRRMHREYGPPRGLPAHGHVIAAAGQVGHITTAHLLNARPELESRPTGCCCHPLNGVPYLRPGPRTQQRAGGRLLPYSSDHAKQVGAGRAARQPRPPAAAAAPPPVGCFSNPLWSLGLRMVALAPAGGEQCGWARLK